MVFAGECRAIDPKVTGFTCTLRREGLALHWIEKQSVMPAARRERALYEHEKIVLRYFDLGGRAFDVTADYWPAGAEAHLFRDQAALSVLHLRGRESTHTTLTQGTQQTHGTPALQPR